MGTGPVDLYDLAAEYLDACVAALGATVPARRFVSPGPPAWDCCPQLTVHVGGPVVAPTSAGLGALSEGHRMTVTGSVNLVELNATIIRCAPPMNDNGQPPPAASLDASARETLADLWAIWNYVGNAKREGVLFIGGCAREVYLDPGVSLVESGGCVGWQVGVRVQLDGYR